jgi:hypothetical protein
LVEPLTLSTTELSAGRQEDLKKLEKEGGQGRFSQHGIQRTVEYPSQAPLENSATYCKNQSKEKPMTRRRQGKDVATVVAINNVGYEPWISRTMRTLSGANLVEYPCKVCSFIVLRGISVALEPPTEFTDEDDPRLG